MTRHTTWGVLLLLALGTLVIASPAAADPDGSFRLSVDRKVLRSGEQLTVRASATVACDWIVEWDGEIRRDRAHVLTTTYLAPIVTRVTKVPVGGRCFPVGAITRSKAPPELSGPSQQLRVQVPESWARSITVTVLPAGSAVSPPPAPDPGGGLPNTGGPSWWLVLTALGMIVAGTATIRSAQRRPMPG